MLLFGIAIGYLADSSLHEIVTEEGKILSTKVYKYEDYLAIYILVFIL